MYCQEVSLFIRVVKIIVKSTDEIYRRDLSNSVIQPIVLAGHLLGELVQISEHLVWYRPIETLYLPVTHSV